MVEPEKELPVATIKEIKKDEITLIIELDGKEQIFPFRITDKVYAFMIKYPATYRPGVVIEFSAHNGLISLIRKAKTFTRATAVIPKPDEGIKSVVPQPVQEPKIVPMETVTQSVASFSPPASAASPTHEIQKLSLSPESVNVKTIGSYDPTKITEYSLEVTIAVAQYENVKFGVKGTDIDAVRSAVIEGVSQLGSNYEPTREACQRYLNRVLLKGDKDI